MASSFPGAVDNFSPSPTPTSPRNNPSLSGKIVKLQDASVAVETYLGITGSADPTSITNKTNANTAAAVANAANIVTTAGLLFGSGVPAGGTGVNGNLYLDTATGIIYRKTAGSWAATYTPAAGGATADPNLNLYSGYKAWNFDQQWAAGTVSPVSGRLYFNKMYIPAGITVNSLKVLVNDTTGTVATGFYAALYNSAGTLLSQSANFSGSLGFDLNTIPLAAPQVIAAGTYYAAIWFVFTGTAPKLYTSVNNNSYQKNIGLASPNLRVGYANTGLTTTAPGTMGAQTTDNSGYWVAFG